MKEIKKYADQWDVSAQYLYDKGDYSWMAQKLTGYSTVVELGCGTGYSTLALAEKGFKVLAVDKNTACLAKAKELLGSKGITDSQVIFIEGDITDENFRKNLIALYKFDVVICWNVGTYWSKEMAQYYVPFMLRYGLNIQQIRENPESSYSELIIWEVCRLAKSMNVSAHIVDRNAEVVNEKNDSYYYMLKNEFEYSEIMYDNLIANSISDGGRILTTNGTVNRSNKIDIVFVSILMR